MRIFASLFALVLIGFGAPAASACRTAPEPVFVPLWDHEPTPDQVQPGEVALEIEYAWSVKSSGSPDPDIVITGCQPFQDLFRIVRVIAGDAPGSRFVILPGSVLIPVTIAEAGAPPALSAPQRIFAVGRLEPQREKYILAYGQGMRDIVTMVPGSDFIARDIPVFQTRETPQ